MKFVWLMVLSCLDCPIFYFQLAGFGIETSKGNLNPCSRIQPGLEKGPIQFFSAVNGNTIDSQDYVIYLQTRTRGGTASLHIRNTKCHNSPEAG